MYEFIEEMVDNIADSYINFGGCMRRTFIEVFLPIVLIITSPIWVWFYIGKRMKYLKMESDRLQRELDNSLYYIDEEGVEQHDH